MDWLTFCLSVSDCPYIWPEVKNWLRRIWKNWFDLFNCIDHRHPTEAGRQHLPREEGKCMKCNLSVVEDEFHFLFECPAYTDYRTNFVSRKFRQPPSTYDFYLPQRRKVFYLCENLYGKQKLHNTIDYCRNSFLLYEHFTCGRHD